ncbi:MAG TPA: Ig-like domain-containing protein [Candidatus Hydrogenedentes bacterium]|nr:Ig-like domain-containing protein [Candidatus Hydrogenedentota bacterium]
MKNHIVLRQCAFFLAGVALISLAGCRPTKITVTPENITLKTGESVTLNAVSTSEKDTSFTWTSNQAEVASIDATGKVTGIKPGIAAIRATGLYSKKQAKILVTVVPSAAPAKPPKTVVEETKPSAEVPIHEPPKQSGEGEEAPIEESEEGEGEAAAAEVHVQSEAPALVPPPAIKITHTPDTLVLTEGGTAYITPMSTSPADTAFTWATTNDAVAAVSPKGEVKAVGPGVSYITSTASQSGAQGSTKMIVTAAAHANEERPQASDEGEYQFLTVYPGNISLQVGQSMALNVLSPNPLDTGFAWSTTNAAVVTVNTAGKVEAVGEGSAFVIATSPYTLSQGLASIVVSAASPEGQSAQ